MAFVLRGRQFRRDVECLAPHGVNQADIVEAPGVGGQHLQEAVRQARTGSGHDGGAIVQKIQNLFVGPDLAAIGALVVRLSITA